MHPAGSVHWRHCRPGIACRMINLGACQRLNRKNAQPCLAARDQHVAVRKQRRRVTRPRAGHTGGTNPSVRLRIENLAARGSDSTDIGAAGDQYPGVVQKGCGVRDVSLEQIRRWRPCARVSCLGISRYRAPAGEPRQYPGHKDAPKGRLHCSHIPQIARGGSDSLVGRAVPCRQDSSMPSIAANSAKVR